MDDQDIFSQSRNERIERVVASVFESTKDTYQKIMNEYSKELERQESVINRNLNELRELIQQYT